MSATRPTTLSSERRYHMSLQSWATFLTMMLGLVVMLVILGIVQQAVGGVNESGLLGGP